MRYRDRIERRCNKKYQSEWKRRNQSENNNKKVTKAVSKSQISETTLFDKVIESTASLIIVLTCVENTRYR